MLDMAQVESAGSLLRERLAVLTRQARREILVLHPDGAPDVLPSVTEAVGRGLAVRLVVPARVGARVGTGVVARQVRSVPVGLFVFDRRVALVATDSVLVTDRGSVALLCSLFDRVWAEASQVAGALTEQESTAVTLLAAGHTDEAVAKRLGVSPRTARRIVTALMARLGARSRFQAGVQAVRAGWLNRADSHV